MGGGGVELSRINLQTTRLGPFLKRQNKFSGAIIISTRIVFEFEVIVLLG